MELDSGTLPRMAPRAPESLTSFRARLAGAVARGASEIRFGLHHASHAVVAEPGRWVVRALQVDPGEAKAFLERHGRFMPEDAETIARPTGDVLLEAPDLPTLSERLGPWWASRGLP